MHARTAVMIFFLVNFSLIKALPYCYIPPVSVGDRWRVKLGDVQNYIHAVHVNVCIYRTLFQGSLADLYNDLDFSVRKAVVKDVNG